MNCLGVTLDQYLDFSDHVELLISKANSKISFLYRYTAFLNNRTCKVLSQSLVMSRLEFCSSSWYPGLAAGLKGKLDVIQRKLVRFTNNFGYREHVGDAEIKALTWLPFPTRISFFQLVHVFKIKAGLCPSYMKDNFTRVSDVHNHGLRQSSHNFSLAHCNCPINTFARSAISLWNCLPAYLKETRTVASFKCSLKRFFMES